MNFLKSFKSCTWIYIVLVVVECKYHQILTCRRVAYLKRAVQKAWWIRALQTGEAKGGLYDSFLLFHGFFKKWFLLLTGFDFDVLFFYSKLLWTSDSFFCSWLFLLGFSEWAIASERTGVVARVAYLLYFLVQGGSLLLHWTAVPLVDGAFCGCHFGLSSDSLISSCFCRALFCSPLFFFPYGQPSFQGPPSTAEVLAS